MSAIVSGIGISRIGRKTGIPAIELTVEAAQAAIADAGLEVGDVDGIATMGDTPPEEAAAALGFEPRFWGDGPPDGGLLAPFMAAVTAVDEGRARHVLVYRTVQMVGGTVTAPPAGSPGPGPGSGLEVMGDLSMLLAYHAYSAANWLAMHCRRHMHRYGTTEQQLGWLAVSSREKARHNPLAVLRDTPLTLEDHATARRISTPFGLYDCDIPVDGSIAVVVSVPEHGPGCPSRPVQVAAMGGALGSGWTGRADYPRMASVEAAADLWSRTELTPADVDVAELYDGFTFLTLAWLEALGLCEEGDSGPFVEGGRRIAVDGELPLNTYGGQLAAGRMHGYWVLHEACVQLRQEGGARQVAARPEVAVVAAGGGPIAGCLLLTA